MKGYHSIPTVFTRDPETNYKTIIEGKYSSPELEYLSNNKWIFTEKVDGANTRITFNGKDITFTGRTKDSMLHSQDGPFLDMLKETFYLKLKLFKKLFPKGVDLFSEGYGPKIHGGGKYSSEYELSLFDVNIDGWWLNRSNIVDIANKLELNIVPIIGVGSLNIMVEFARTGFLSRWGDFPAEGIVARPEVELQTRGGDRIITKIKYKDFKVD